MLRQILCLLLALLLVFPALAEEDSDIAGLADALPAYQRFRQACEKAGYTLLPETACQVVYDSEGMPGYAYWEPLAGVIFSFYQQVEEPITFTAFVDQAYFPDSKPLLSLALATIDPGFTTKTAVYYLTRMEGTLSADESSAGLLYTVFEGLRYVYVLTRSTDGTQLLIHSPYTE